MAARKSTATTVCKRTLVYPICVDPKTKRFRAPGPRMAGCYSELRTVCRSRKTGTWAPRPHRGSASNRTEGTRMAVKMPTVAEVVAALQAENRYLTKNKIPETDVRLQVYPNSDWTLRTGDSSYDQDHRGYWGSSSIAKGRLPLGVARTIAQDLIAQASEQAAEDEDRAPDSYARHHGRTSGRLPQRAVGARHIFVNTVGGVRVGKVAAVTDTRAFGQVETAPPGKWSPRVGSWVELHRRAEGWEWTFAYPTKQLASNAVMARLRK